MNKADRTRQFIIKKTAEIFNKKGYSGTSLSDLTMATGLTKGSIYGNFANKDEVAIAVYDYNSTELAKNLDLAILGQQEPLDKLMAAVDYYRNNWKEFFAEGGCPILNTAIEADDNLPFLKSRVQRSIFAWSEKVYDLVEAGKHAGVFKENAASAEFSYTMITLIEGGVMIAKITGDERHLFSALDRVVKIIKDEIIR